MKRDSGIIDSVKTSCANRWQVADLSPGEVLGCTIGLRPRSRVTVAPAGDFPPPGHGLCSSSGFPPEPVRLGKVTWESAL